MVLDSRDESPDEEFTEDILAIMQVFARRWNGKRRYEPGGARERGSPDGSTDGSGVPDRV
jgi:predicted site-specific integrase-resolvase